MITLLFAAKLIAAALVVGGFLVAVLCFTALMLSNARKDDNDE